jgi:hypothetical protein
MNNLIQIKHNINDINKKISKAAKASGRTYKDITLIAVTKSFPTKAWEASVLEGLFVIGESRIKETENKYNLSNKTDKIELHLIGHLQRNKVRKALNLFDTVQTVDSLKLANRINVIAKEKNKIQNIYIQVNAGEDPNKKGFSLDNIFEKIKTISAMQNISVNGIMTIPPILISKKKLRFIYKQTKNIRDRVYEKINKSCINLSMGMSGDYEIAIEEGATHIRIGSAIFGKRTT